MYLTGFFPYSGCSRLVNYFEFFLPKNVIVKILYVHTFQHKLSCKNTRTLTWPGVKRLRFAVKMFPAVEKIFSDLMLVAGKRLRSTFD